VTLPAAQRYLTLADWVEIDEVFGTSLDPCDWLEAKDNLDDLYTLIVQTMASNPCT
jgi:hypothetical protein